MDYIIGLPERHRGQDGVPLAVHWLRVLAEFRGTREILSWKVGDGSTQSADVLDRVFCPVDDAKCDVGEF